VAVAVFNNTRFSFQLDVLEASAPFLVDFWAFLVWAPCRLSLPLMDLDSGATMRVGSPLARIEVDANPSKPRPTTRFRASRPVLFRDGK